MKMKIDNKFNKNFKNFFLKIFFIFVKYKNKTKKKTKLLFKY